MASSPILRPPEILQLPQREFNDYYGNINPLKMGKTILEGRACGIDTPEILNIREYLKRTRAGTGKLFKGWTTLQAIVERNESVLQKRWMKMTTKWRREILLTAWPNMVVFHHPDLAINRMSLANTPATHKWDTAAYKWPYINLEDLVKPNSLPLLLNSRGRNRPGSFARAYFRLHIQLVS